VTDSKPSKSAKKREHLALQELGEELIALNESELASLRLDDRLSNAVRDARKIKSRGALRRQKQLIGKLMGDIDPQPIRVELVKLRAEDLRSKQLFARAERWRDRITSERTTALSAFDDEFGQHDAELHALLAELEVAYSERAEKTVRRKIFRRIHELLVTRVLDG
jgi:ribosome-associated protein